MDYPHEFEIVWTIMPKRDLNNPKKAAFKAWKARLKEGVSQADLESAARAYYGYCKQKGIIGTDKVMMAQTFFGPNERWEAFKGGDTPATNEHNLESLRPTRTTSTMSPVSVTEPPEPRIDARPFIADLLRGLAESKKAPTCNHERANK